MSKQQHLTQSSRRMSNCFQRVYMAVITSLLCLASMATVDVAIAAAASPQVVVEHVTDLGVFKGRQYRRVEGLMTNTWTRADSTTGHYRAPLIMIFPVKRGRRGNGVGLVDVPNTAIFGLTLPRPKTIDDIFQWGERTMGDFLIDKGFTYISVMWAKFPVDLFGAAPPAGQRRGLGYGTIERGGTITTEDNIRIVQDTARLLRNPPSFGDQVETPDPVEQVLGFGYSQTATRLAVQFVRGPNNFEADGSLIFDGFMLGGNIAPSSTPYPVDRGKVINLYTETDLLVNQVYLDRVSVGSSSYRQYEMPGVAHIPEPLAPWDEFGAVRQNPADFAPVYRAVVSHLTGWIREGVEPPPSLLMDGTVQSNGSFVPVRDADGNATGGLRLPHMPSVVCNDDEDDGPPPVKQRVHR
jgi:hypothetical protein